MLIDTPGNNDFCYEAFEMIWEKYPRKDYPTQAYAEYLTCGNGRQVDGKTIRLTNRQMWYAVLRYAEEVEEAKTEKQYIKSGKTFFEKCIYDYVKAE